MFMLTTKVHSQIGTAIFIGVLFLLISQCNNQLMPSAIDEGDCPLPPIQYVAGAEPLQTAVPKSLSVFSLSKVNIVPVAGFSINGRVLSTQTEKWDGASPYSRLDIALGWGQLMDDKIIAQIKFRQSFRILFWNAKTANLPLSNQAIGDQLSNIHTIPSNKYIAKQLNQLKTDDRVRLDGWLVNVDLKNAKLPDEFKKLNRYKLAPVLKSSTSRTDVGLGACEILYVCQVKRY